LARLRYRRPDQKSLKLKVKRRSKTVNLRQNFRSGPLTISCPPAASSCPKVSAVQATVFTGSDFSCSLAAHSLCCAARRRKCRRRSGKGRLPRLVGGPANDRNRKFCSTSADSGLPPKLPLPVATTTGRVGPRGGSSSLSPARKWEVDHEHRKESCGHHRRFAGYRCGPRSRSAALGNNSMRQAGRTRGRSFRTDSTTLLFNGISFPCGFR
jgi:hypothetical protein